MSDQFGKKVRHVRLKKGLTQTDVADLLAASGSHISNMEAGRKAPSLDTVVRLADAFHVTTDYLLRDTIPIEDIAEYILSPSEKRDSAFTLLSTKLRYLRTQRHMHQADLARQLGLRTQAHISLLEAGHKEPSISLLLRIADFFGVTIDYLLRDNIPISNVEIPEE
jgi:transcriptional regulator with XRE-family HTH domain